MFDCAHFPPWAVMDGCVGGCAYVHPHVLDDFVIHELVKADAREFIRCGGMN